MLTSRPLPSAMTNVNQPACLFFRASRITRVHVLLGEQVGDEHVAGNAHARRLALGSQGRTRPAQGDPFRVQPGAHRHAGEAVGQDAHALGATPLGHARLARDALHPVPGLADVGVLVARIRRADGDGGAVAVLGQVGAVIELLVQVDQDDLIERQPRPVRDPLELLGDQGALGAHDLAAGRGVLEHLLLRGRLADERRVDFLRRGNHGSRRGTASRRRVRGPAAPSIRWPAGIRVRRPSPVVQGPGRRGRPPREPHTPGAEAPS